ncbi:hypothetical protein BN1723_008705 [Verticillium longisporum]|uniref:Uncharacterized protein n=1 Tax=Verticillium longisporum TaxID=100787 RepID=A0A0G4KJ69_VERLO|nr:hypothetical protein BN1723_008705 [Verticillium longisporum]
MDVMAVTPPWFPRLLGPERGWGAIQDSKRAPLQALHPRFCLLPTREIGAGGLRALCSQPPNVPCRIGWHAKDQTSARSRSATHAIQAFPMARR